ncbi:Dimer-Tnp-hAT domain-containing protein [Mycena venus]|uniref:Dimer-Tnp-hAT domain-containing protein n=1 Tax=Mycena venus TaxID=2733690 RepID=A0A8H6WUD4_9AGAR|nr:Dimer-Tnp-hAT domain-containing protein [Mycena venus]
MAPPPETKPKVRRNRNPSSKLVDDNNGEALSAVHQQVLVAKPVLDMIKKIARLSTLLPETVPEAADTDDIHRIITTVHGIEETVAGTLNRCFDLLFAEDCRDVEGCLKNIRRGGGRNGMCGRLPSIDPLGVCRRAPASGSGGA